VVASGLSGPGRSWRGSVRDHVLGVKLVTGYGKTASFGGQVMKNVAGYDISRLITGSMGTLGLILEVSLKVLPKPATELTLTLDMPDKEAYELTTTMRRSTFPLSATCYFDGCLYLRLSGVPNHVFASHRKIGGEPLNNPDQFWLALRNQTHEFFQQYDRPLWRLSFPPATNVVSRLEGNSLVEWGGAQRWVYTNIPVNLIRNIAHKGNGHATLYRGSLPGVNPFQPLPTNLLSVQQRLKQAMDPHGIFNPGRLYKDW
jgi:glycolate oxidase FAD binding subunit